MNKIFIQIYEIQTPREAESMIALGVDHIGTVLLNHQEWKSSAIRSTVETIHEHGAVSSLIPLFNDPDTVFKVLDYYRPDIVHFCEMPVEKKDTEGFGYNHALIKRLVDLQVKIREKFPQIKIMRSVPIPPSGFSDKVNSVDFADIFEPVSDLFLTDTFLISDMEKNRQPVEGFVGITGKTCDWDVASRLVQRNRLPVILAGGISPDNAYEAILKVRPAGVDSCTLTNVMNNKGVPVRFKKDPEKVKKLVMETRKAEKELFQKS